MTSLITGFYPKERKLARVCLRSEWPWRRRKSARDYVVGADFVGGKSRGLVRSRLRSFANRSGEFYVC